MGADASFPLTPVKPGFSTMSMTFSDDDRITVLHLDSAGLSTVAQAIKDTWEPGIQAEQSRCGTGWSFKLKGYPFGSVGKVTKQVRQMIMHILQRLHGIGYQAVASGTLGTRTDKSTLFFRKAPSNIRPPQFLCVGFSGSDQIQFTNLPTQLIDPLKDTVRTSWSLGIQNINMQDGILQFKLAGNPWTATNNKQSIMAKKLLQDIFAKLHCYQWVFHLNVNVNGKQDCLIFRQDVNVNPNEVVQFCMISFGEGDRLRLINMPDDVISMIRKIIETNWTPGTIQDEREFHDRTIWEFKISGHPWNSVNEESARARFLMLKVFQEMLTHGWHNIAGFYLDRESSDRVTLVFQKREPNINCPMFCIAPSDDDKFWLINMPTELVSLFKNILQSRWAKGIRGEKVLPLHFGMVYKLTLTGSPWMGGDSNSPIHARSFLCSILEEFLQRGWKLIICADVTSRIVGENNGPDYPLDVYSFWFAFNPTSAMPPPSAPTFPPTFATNPEQYGFQMGFTPYPPSAYTQDSSYGNPVAPPPPPNEAPPSYSEATGWTSYGELANL